MHIQDYVMKKLTLRERFMAWLLKMRTHIHQKKMDRFLIKAFKDNMRACRYEEFLKKSDEEYYDFVKKMNIKYA